MSARAFLLLLFLAAGAAGPLAAREGLQPGGTSRAIEVVDGDTLILQDGREVRLVGLQAPKLPLGRPNFRTWPLADEAKAALESLALNRTLRVSYGGERVDRHGRHLAHLHTDDGTWIQGEMLRRGMARVYSWPDNRALVTEMLALEREARAARRGIWDHDYYRIRRHDETRDDLDSFQLVEGRVERAARGGRNVYLNFGDNWRRDFTVTLLPEDQRRFEAAGIDPLQLEGRRVRVRGWLRWRNGPMIRATHPEQIELLEN